LPITRFDLYYCSFTMLTYNLAKCFTNL
jgi:hypothetical protein